jgi:antitoxin (DNA-binding transcriptional repressor) of toxin-antitoxin stability system
VLESDIGPLPATDCCNTECTSYATLQARLAFQVALATAVFGVPAAEAHNTTGQLRTCDARHQNPRPETEIATYVTYTRNMSENAMPLPYEVQEMTTTEARKHLPDLVNMAAYGHVTTVLTRDGRRLARIVPEEDAWVYSPAWQEKLQEAEADLAAGRVRRFDSDEELLGHLEAVDDETGG